MAELKPCPFCGNIPVAKFNIVVAGQVSDWNVVECNNEKCRIKPFTDWHKSKSVVVREWNRSAGDE